MQHFSNILLYLLTFNVLMLTSNTNFVYSADTTSQIRKYGYLAETYQFWTPDKYLLGLERIPFNKRESSITGPPVLLIHGLFVSSIVFAFENTSLSFVLSDAGFDVWLFNARGLGLSRSLNIYSKNEVKPKMNKISWDFSWHEMGISDLTTAIDFVLNKTGYTKLNIVGYSLGTTISLVCLSDRPDYNNKVNNLVLMAPTSRLKSVGPPLILIKRYTSLIMTFLNQFDYFPYTMDPDLTYKLIGTMCRKRIMHDACKWFFDFAHGISIPMSNDKVANILSLFPQPVSTKTLKHYIQLILSGRFSHYDYGKLENIKRYGTEFAPDYNLLNVTSPTFIFHSKDDTIVPPLDVDWLAKNLPNVKYIRYINNTIFGHLSFSISPNSMELVSIPIANIFKENNFDSRILKPNNTIYPNADLVIGYGYPIEIHQILTKDNYVVGLERIPHGKNSNRTIGKAIILLHGLFGSSIQFTLVNNSLSFMLADAGFDVWMLNYRLTGISKHLKHPKTGKIMKLASASWNFDFDDLALNDMIQSIDYVLEKTGYNKIDLGGYSLGGTLALIGLSERPEYNKKVDRLLLMAPATRMKNLHPRFAPAKKMPPFILNSVAKLNYLPRVSNPDEQIGGIICNYKLIKKLCLAMYYHIETSKSPTIKESPIILKVFPQPSSMKLVKHFFQLAFNDEFFKFDYGKVENFKHYNSSKPPVYNISKVEVPTIIVHSKYDAVSTPKDNQWLAKQLPNVIDVHFITEVFTHQSYTLSPYAKDVNLYIVNMLLKNN
ncbi:uncharacterized protein LOC126893533 [Daktulosphaira vitifoliae]|uniref:uncharacterized protein LOC126893533 n=1 Tax=Daktulosphaira vitifoliae TaxID=58002 RepID=UPI0021AA66CE|nr:uncharacterized protein LOC126893533 [Daktulosphaira vitifoliae]